MSYIFLLSGPIAAGKTALTDAFQNRFQAKRLSTRKFLKAIENSDDRDQLIALGLELDKSTDGKWVLDGFRDQVGTDADSALWLIDAVRTERQVFHFRDAFGTRVVHVHLTAPLEILRQRYKERDSSLNEYATYDEARKHGTEQYIEKLAAIADIVAETNRCDPSSLLARATAGLGLFPMEPERLVDVLVGAQYGSEGKGNICAHIANDYQVLMRVGGPNAGHKVAFPKYDYIQLPSGTLSNLKATIVIGAGATLSVEQVLKEIKDLDLTPERLAIDPQAMIIEQTDRQQEEKTMEVIGSTKKGVGVATARKILGRDGEAHWGSTVRLARNVDELRPFIRCTKTVLERAYAAGQRVLLEGTQGTDLSIHHGQYPHVTSRETTASGCLADAGIAPTRVRKVIMVMRTYPIRVGGTSGDMMGEIELKTIADRSGIPEAELKATEVGTVSGKPRRIAEFDWEQVRRAASINGVTDIALTFADYISVENRKAQRFDQLTEETRKFIAEVERVTNAHVSLIAKDFGRFAVMIDRRTWR
ncbi:adenylosuccinate synthase [Mesorhizobium sp. M6A.T.Cr.TU.017.01.1.1]|uniref:adenylosuccinate synthetase n=1 Tax=Mesorhizobium sp. M6A.T.Cr.TU.017.01.1.1 TaxID=2496774 RepID=UPI000FD5A894|nr:adenylosuccinate synthetase [Mesorhizobium sp. M6A.T.Cr.TU.017.01.1.1]RUV05200.1 adenylosuccinate synthase [Mesorhizobium sp. M6A.T.Cr.TU.017.01.1.1]